MLSLLFAELHLTSKDTHIQDIGFDQQLDIKALDINHLIVHKAVSQRWSETN